MFFSLFSPTTFPIYRPLISALQHSSQNLCLQALQYFLGQLSDSMHPPRSIYLFSAFFIPAALGLP